MFQPKKRVPATVEFADMAAGRSEAKTLVDVVAYKNADALLHVVRAFRDPAVAHPQGSIDPGRDARVIEDELVLADLGVAERRLERLEKDLKKSASADLRREQDVLIQCKATLENGKALRTLGLTGDDLRRLRGFQFLSAKPLLVVVNLDEADVSKMADAESAGLGSFVSDAHAASVAVCAKIELEIAQLDPADAQAFMADLGLKESGLDRVIRAAYDLLGYISFFTVGEDECRAWSIPRHAGGGSGRRDPLGHPARIHSRGGRPRRDAALARLAPRLPRSRRASAGGQGIPRGRRRRDQLSARHVIRFARF
jgi:hypothetical protein